MKKIQKMVVSCAALVGLYTASYGADSAKVLNACTVNWPPYTIIDEATKKITGSDTDLVRKVVEKMGYTIAIQDVPWKRCLELTKSGEVQIIYAVSIKPERKEFIIFPKEPLHPTSYVFATLEGAPSKWGQSKDPSAAPQPVGSIQGYSVTDELKKVLGDKVQDTVMTDAQNFQKLILGRVGSIVIESTALKSLLVNYQGAKKVEVLHPAFEDEKEYYIGVSKKFGGSEKEVQALADKISKTLIEVKAGGKK